MKISKDLNLILNMEDSKGDFVVHSVPIPTELFVANRKVLMSAYREMTSEGLPGIQASIAVATMILKESAEKHNRTNEINELINTIIGASTVIRGKNLLLQFSDVDEDVKEEVVDRLVFFYIWQLFVPPSQKKDWIQSISFMLNLDLRATTVQEILSSSSTANETSETTSDTSAPIGVTATSLPI